MAFDGALVGSVFALSGIASLIMPALIGIVSDKWINAERLMGGLHFVGAIALFSAAFISDYDWFKIAMLVNMLAYMPTLSLSYTVAYNAIGQSRSRPGQGLSAGAGVGYGRVYRGHVD